MRTRIVPAIKTNHLTIKVLIKAIYNGRPGRGVRLLAASEVIALHHGVKLTVEGESTYVIFQRALGTAQQQLASADFEAALQEGRALTMDQAIALKTEDESNLPPAG